MSQENETAIPTQDHVIVSCIFISVEMIRSKWVVGVQTPLADKIALHTMASGDVDALLALIDRAQVKLAAVRVGAPSIRPRSRPRYSA
ncbi:MAG: hypothetical protein QM636_22375, partial [Rhizobium sp.]